jgi:hypothetical protein
VSLLTISGISKRFGGITANREILDAPALRSRATPWKHPEPGAFWTDQRTSLLAALR